VLLAPAGATQLDSIPGLVPAAAPITGSASVQAGVTGVRVELPPDGVSFEVLERAILERAMAMADGNVSRAARLLDLSRDTLRYRLRKHGLESHLDADDGG
jgi:transcriptional regulator of acetoin/glycerol metabolism